MNYFFVSQRKTYKEEHSQSYLWAPHDGIWHHETMSKVKKGDAIIQYTGEIVGIGIASRDNYSFDRPEDDGFKKWIKQGYKVDVEQFHFITPVKKEFVKNALLEAQPKGYAPLNMNGGVNQGYLFPANKAMVDIILQKALEIDQSPKQSEIVKKIQDTLNMNFLENNESVPEQKQYKMKKDVFIQKIFFGAPGTGKSYKVNSILAEQRKNTFASSDISKSNHYAEVLSDKNYIDCNIWMIDNLSILEKKLASFEADDKVSNPRHSALRAYIEFFKKYEEEHRENRTTFHPDYDYAQFVGVYKPKKVQYGDDGSLSEEELSQKLSEAFTDNGNGEIDKTTAITLFGLQYANSLNGKTISQIVKNSGIGDEQYKKANLSAAVKARLQFLDIEEKITYSFVPQVFAKAYAAAWNQYFKSDNASTTGNQVYLVIEEINRGNCAQIFGDIFQLLDRDGDGFSQYAIDADCDFADWLENDEAGLKSVWDKYKDKVGEGKLKLPPNLNILATMNTSDQSLFPMDSAFKRRFDWEYVPISFDGKDAANYQIEVEGSANPYSWKDFVETVNEKILKITESEDKQLGEYFIKPDKKNENGEYVVISCERFLGKVMFYLWNEVCKDEHKNGSFFRVKIDGKEEYFTFQDLYKKQGLLKQFMDELLKKE